MGMEQLGWASRLSRVALIVKSPTTSEPVSFHDQGHYAINAGENDMYIRPSSSMSRQRGGLSGRGLRGDR